MPDRTDTEQRNPMTDNPLNVAFDDLNLALEQIESYAMQTNEAAAHCAGDCWARATEAYARAAGLHVQAKSLLGDIKALTSAQSAPLAGRFIVQIERLEQDAEALQNLAYAMADLDSAYLTASSEFAQATEDSQNGVDAGYYPMWMVTFASIERLKERVLLPETTDADAIALAELACETLADAFEERHDYRWSPPEF